MLNIVKLNLLDKNKIPYTINEAKTLKNFPPSVREWKNSIYVYNKNGLNLIPNAAISAIKIIRSYFLLYNRKIEKKIRTERLLFRYRRLSSNKIYISNGEFKHTNNKVIVNLYLFNRQKYNYILALKKLYLKTIFYIRNKHKYHFKRSNRLSKFIPKKVKISNIKRSNKLNKFVVRKIKINNIKIKINKSNKYKIRNTKPKTRSNKLMYLENFRYIIPKIKSYKYGCLKNYRYIRSKNLNKYKSKFLTFNKINWQLDNRKVNKLNEIMYKSLFLLGIEPDKIMHLYFLSRPSIEFDKYKLKMVKTKKLKNIKSKHIKINKVYITKSNKHKHKYTKYNKRINFIILIKYNKIKLSKYGCKLTKYNKPVHYINKRRFVYNKPIYINKIRYVYSKPGHYINKRRSKYNKIIPTNKVRFVYSKPIHNTNRHKSKYKKSIYDTNKCTKFDRLFVKRVNLINKKGFHLLRLINRKKYLVIKALKKNKKTHFFLSEYINNFYKKFVKKSLRKLQLYIYYRQLLYINKSKYNYSYLQYLNKYIFSLFNKNIEYNLINLKRFYLHSDILSESIKLKLTKNKKRILKKLNTIKKKVKIKRNKVISRRKIYKELDLKRNLSKLPIYLKKNIIKKLKYKYISGFRLEAKGRLTRRYTASRSLSKIKYKGNLLNLYSSKKGLSTVLLRGNLRSNLQHTKLKSKSRIGSFGIKGWVSGN